MKRIRYYFAKLLKLMLNPAALDRCKIDRTAKVWSGSELSRVTLGRYSYIGSRCFMVNTTIGNFCSIADRCCIGGAMHPIERVSSSPVFHEGKNIMKKNFATFPGIETPKTKIGNDVWMGMGCYVKAGVTIHDGAVVGMGSIVTHDIPAYEIWAGNPAKKIRNRFEPDVAAKIQDTQWWNWPDNVIYQKSDAFDDVEKFIQRKK